VLETARAAQTIGQSLEADITLSGVTREQILGDLDVDLAKFFIVSHVDFADAAAEGITMLPARGKKCGRCWQYREEVVEDGGLCKRCEDVVAGLAVPEAPTA